MGKRFARRKWGWYLTLLDRKHFKVKILRFKGFPASCSKQYHNLRNELWLFLTGMGSFECNGWDSAVNAGMFRSVGIGQWHQYTAVGPTYVLEIQYGEKCEESDIVRV